ncbi:MULTISPECIES: AbrB/MazE/SpoVT family DNA-binding domain-containing protein [unclassified Paenibacillus]|uniref:AbrB/MazE/SpoVT family DNA-binding domain-containing protein n=1 Tax=unclassified Paenibacillus TaxID=185978 RepID=UPI001AE38ED4|nr:MULTISPECIES: AbrB/MazE/SpoVT family DNA-binding domain-containing protein [unclassified Paenibacillus]MBP1156488.1 AbrB family looped-hinge helix DNA binding protein [Paenibacillus sp. PvP091]MBP1168126.1 AbrB family looped-hinge helix DNA binding protein [Paenibacillus sp. PvR098]MBP2439154.1 AbrB family looped-hinge helix DNA binding protein [Paenibacillus sp. PvP052]
MEISRISSKGQVTIPKSIRELLEVDAGDRILFIEENGRAYIAKASLVALNDYQLNMTKGARNQGISKQEFENKQAINQEDSWGKPRVKN